MESKMIMVNGEPRFEFKVRVEYKNGSRHTFSIWANNKYDARKAAVGQIGNSTKIIWVK